MGFFWDFHEILSDREGSVIRFGPFELDRTQGLRRDKQELRISPKSLSVLWELASRAGQLVTKDQLFCTVWADAVVTDSALTSCIQELRQAFRDDARRPQFIETLHRRGYRFVAKTSTSTQTEPILVSTGTHVIGQECAIRDTLEVWQTAERGTRQVLFLSGEPGIGKTTVAQQAVTAITRAGGARATWGQCVQHYGIGEPYQPLLEALMRLCRQPGGGDLVGILERYAPTWLAQLPALLDPERHASLRRTVTGTTGQRMLRELNDALEAATTHVPLVLCLEDLHWSDASTLDWLASFAQRPEPARLLLLATFRPEPESGGGHPLSTVVDGLHVKRCCREISLSGMSESEVADYMAARVPPALGHAHELHRLAILIHRHTGGNPLFVLNVLDDLVARGLLLDQDRKWASNMDLEMITLGTPDDVRRVIAAQFERLPPTASTVLEVASVAGSTFSVPTVAGASGLAAGDVEATLAGLERQHRFVRRRGTRFEFDHVLYRDVLYDRIPPGRRAILHREVAEREAAGYGERAREIAAELAMHFERSGDIVRAGIYLQQAAENARTRSAFSEARMHFEKALVLIADERASRDRTEREIRLLIGLGAAAMAARGWGTPDAERAYSRARVLCQEHGESPELFPALWGLWLFYWGRGPLGTAHELAQDLLRLAGSHGEDGPLLQAHHAAWATAFSSGDLQAACFHAGEGLRLYDPHRHASTAATYGNHDVGVCARLFLARASALLGRIEDAIRMSDDAIALARTLEHPFSLALAHVFASAVAQACRQTDRVRAHAEAATAIARDHDFRLLLAWSSAFEGWAAAVAGNHEKGISQIVDAIAEARAAGSDQFVPHLAGLAADAYLISGNTADGLKIVEDGLAVAARTGERFWNPELLRLRGELLIAQDPTGAAIAAEHAFREAIEDARSQGAILLTVRAAASLGRSLERTGRGGEVCNLILELSRNLQHRTGPDADEANALLSELRIGGHGQEA